jgi:hypothetical protein
MSLEWMMGLLELRCWIQMMTWMKITFEFMEDTSCSGKHEVLHEFKRDFMLPWNTTADDFLGCEIQRFQIETLSVKN